MQKSIISPIAVLLGAILFNFLFWDEKQGLNTLLFDIFIVLTLWQLDKEPFLTPSVKITTLGTLLAAVLIVWHNSILVKFIHIVSFTTMVGLMQKRKLRFLGFALLQYFSNWFTIPAQLFNQLKSFLILTGQKNIANRLSGILLPILIVPVFYLIYFAANAKFAEFSSQFWDKVLYYISFDINIGRVVFFGFGIFIVGATVWQQRWIDFEQLDLANKQTLEEPKNFENESLMYRNALNLILSLNILLLVNNIIDVRYVWFGDVSGKTALELKQYVHEGTYVLIFGIVLAISVILWLFRDSLNFIDETGKKSNLLRGATTFWLVQNAVLAVSVGIRNGQYIDHYGLAYKRIGVFIFLLLTLYGLWLLFVKIKEKRTFFSFIQQSSYAIYAVLLATCLINWDVFITKFNIGMPSKSGAIDVRFLVEDVSDKNIYLLFDNTELLATKMSEKPFPDSEYSQTTKFADAGERLTYLKTVLKDKKNDFEERQKTYSWLSWNYADYRNQHFFQQTTIDFSK